MCATPVSVLEKKHKLCIKIGSLTFFLFCFLFWNTTVLTKSVPTWIYIFHLSLVSLDDISAVRVGRQSEGFKKSTEEQVESRCFSIVFKGRRKNLDLIASSEEEARRWVSSLQKMMSTMNSLNQMQKTEQYPFLK